MILIFANLRRFFQHLQLAHTLNAPACQLVSRQASNHTNDQLLKAEKIPLFETKTKLTLIYGSPLTYVTGRL